MKISRSFVVYQGPAILVAVIIFIFASLPSPPDIKLSVTNEDLIKHAIAYAVFGFFIARALFFQHSLVGLRKRYLIFAIIFGILYGISDEFHQLFVPGRSSEVRDALADAVGVIIGTLLFYLNRRRLLK